MNTNLDKPNAVELLNSHFNEINDGANGHYSPGVTKLILQFAACLLRNVYALPWGIRLCWKTDAIITANVA